MTDHFPKSEGKWKSKIKGYQVVKETSAEKIGREYSLLHTKNHGKKKESPAHGFLLMKLAANPCLPKEEKSRRHTKRKWDGHKLARLVPHKKGKQRLSFFISFLK